jgi:F-type H+-transporting ATPase subunit gamma
MATLREIRRRIAGVKSTQKITKAMKMVSAAKLRRAQDAIIGARPYARKMKELIGHLLSAVEEVENPYLFPREIKNIAIVVVTSDRGLCGAFNSNIIKAAVNHINQNYSALNQSGKLHLVTIGKKGYDYFMKRSYKVDKKYIGIFHNLNFEYAKDIVAELSNGFLSGKYDKVEIIYNEFKSVMQQRIAIETLFPLGANGTGSASGNNKSKTDYIYEPSAIHIVNSLIPKYLNFQIWRILLESNAAEQGARMTAMDNATTNARDLISSLQLGYNKARQASITKELLEIVSGAEALKKTG